MGPFRGLDAGSAGPGRHAGSNPAFGTSRRAPCDADTGTVTSSQGQGLGAPDAPRHPCVHAPANLFVVIVRVLTAKVRFSKVAAFDTLIREQAKSMRGQPGLEYVKLARRVEPDGGEEVVLFEEWRDASSMYAWVGPNLAEPRLVDGARELVEELTITHYEALDREAAFEDVRRDDDEDDSEEADAREAG
jgi:quinol monooxygenase YgiN